MVQTLALIRRFGQLDAPVLIEGETGTGKDLAAAALHAMSQRAGRPFVVIDCGALPEGLLESELFGHERGAFTGADRSYAGRIVAAAGGTLFLDEINSISLSMQGKLLRFLEDGAFYRIGQARPVAVDVRVVAASNVPLEQLVTLGRMRQDFFYRINILRIYLPPLRDRLDDLPLLVEQFLATEPLAKQLGVSAVDDRIIADLRALPLRGNVRELHNLLRRALALTNGGGVLSRLPPDDDPPDLPRTGTGLQQSQPVPPFRTWFLDRQREYLRDLITRYQTRSLQSRASGLPPRTLYRKIHQLGLHSRLTVGTGIAAS
jgi:transcriptional regulator with PAS, ATPase and Fis domain